MSYLDYQGKHIYYREIGTGKPLLFLHGNTASSKMFDLLLPLYDEFYIILIDFLGHGKSDRIDRFPMELWKEESLQTIALLEHLNYGKVSLAGTSGGAWVALNTALERQDLVEKVIADSFDGRTLSSEFSKDLVKERVNAKKEKEGRMFYEWCQGKDWEKVVDLDTEALVQLAKRKLPLIYRPLKELQIPLLLLGSKGDTMVRKDLYEEYIEIAKQVPCAKICMFEEGSHPAILSNAERAAEEIKEFLND